MQLLPTLSGFGAVVIAALGVVASLRFCDRMQGWPRGALARDAILAVCVLDLVVALALAV